MLGYTFLDAESFLSPNYEGFFFSPLLLLFISKLENGDIYSGLLFISKLLVDSPWQLSWHTQMLLEYSPQILG